MKYNIEVTITECDLFIHLFNICLWAQTYKHAMTSSKG